MKKLFLPLLVLIAGAATGGAAAYGAGQVMGPPSPPGAAARDDSEETSFVPVTKITAPLVMADGRLSGYVSFDVELKVPIDKADFVRERLPLLLHAINMRTYRTPMAAGPDGMLPEIGVFRKIVMDAAPEAFGPGVVRMAAVTHAVPV